MIKPVMLSIALSIAVGGCATPRVKYGYFHGDNTRKDVGTFSDTYMLPKTVLTLTTSPLKELEGNAMADDARKEVLGGGPQSTRGKIVGYALNLRRAEDTRQSFGISPLSRHGVSTTVTLAKVENTQLIQSATVAVRDKRKEYIATAFKTLTTVLGIINPSRTAAMASVTARFPIDIDTLDKLNANKCGRMECEFAALSSEVDGVTAWMEVEAVPPDAMPIDMFAAQLSEAGGVLVSSACRQATIHVDMPEGVDDLISHFSLADPRYVQLIGLPAKGTITSHSECGYSVLSGDAELVPDVDVASSFLSELAELIKAQAKSAKSDEPKKE